MTTPLSMTNAVPSLGGSAEVDTAAATTYTDVNGLESLKKDPNSPAAIAAVAQQVEAMFLQMMLKSMRDATAAENPDGNEMGMYQDMFDKQIALNISQHADLGIGKLLKKQISGSPSGSARGLSNGATTGAVSEGAAPAGAAPAAALGRTPAEFINRILPPIRRAAGALGVSPEALLAQAALETGWGQRLPRNTDGSSSHNLFGVKAGADWSGARATAATLEISDGIATTKRTAFRAYGSIEASIDDFAKLLAASPRYQQAVAAGGDASAYIAAIGGSGYATDPDYANKLSQILDSGTIQAVLSSRVAKL